VADRPLPRASAPAADVAVVGAGPAGAAAAIRLARASRRVALIDKAVFPRDKCCGDGLTTGALRRLARLGLDPGVVGSWQPVSEAVVVAPNGRQVALPLPPGGTFAATARRSELDAALVDLATRAGARLLQGCTVTSASVVGGGPLVRLETSHGPIEAPYVIAADGMWSPLRKAFDAHDQTGYRGDWHALRQYFSSTGPDARKLWVWFEPDLLPGYAWSFPLPDGAANAGFGIHRRAGQATGNMTEKWAELLRRPHIAGVLGRHASPDAPAKTWPIPARIGLSPLVAAGGSVLFVGDAARATDSMTGEGIAQAVETAELAAYAILRAQRPEAAGRRYEQAVMRTLAVDDRLSQFLSDVLRRPSAPWLPVVAANDWTKRNFARWMFEDYPRAVLATPRRWRPGMFHGPPPYPATP
jgi:geranylgeranyl reductase family protein